MAEPEFTLKIDRNPQTPTDSTLVDARQASRDAREKITDAVVAQKAVAAAPIISDPVPHEADEDLESVEVQLPNGMLVEFGPPRDVSLTMRIIKLLGDAPDAANGLYRLLLCVRAINGKTVPPITNTIEGEKLANQLGDAGIEILAMVNKTHWRPIRLSQLPVIKKNQRKP